jgi:hypothetical protein
VHSPASKRGAPSLNGLVASLVALFEDRPELGIVLPLVAVHLVHDEVVEGVLGPVPRDGFVRLSGPRRDVRPLVAIPRTLPHYTDNRAVVGCI